MPSTVRFVGNNVVGANCKIGEYVKLENCVVLDGAEIKTGSEFSDCVVLPSKSSKTISSKLEVKEILTV